ncbi:topoisomerase C-terminal repeat-containing protein, partial [Rhizobium ruizarguesonis]
LALVIAFRIVRSTDEGAVFAELQRQVAGASDLTDARIAAVLNEPKNLGTDPTTGEELTLRSGRFGPYIQRGDGKEAKRASLPKGWKPEDIDYEKA